MMKMQSNQIKKTSSLLALLSFTAYLPVSCAAQAASIDYTLPVIREVNGKQMVINGSVARNNDKKKVNAIVNGGIGTVAQFDWETFNVAKGAQVNWQFSANSQTALNRVLGGTASQIYGKLTQSSGSGCANCIGTNKVILINPNGILFGNGSSVNLNSFTASTKDIAGVKNVQDVTNLDEYAGVAKKEADGKTYQTNGTLFDIAGYHEKAKAVQFVKNSKNGKITVKDGAKFNIDATVDDNVDKKDINGNTLNLSTKDSAKSVVFIADDIKIDNSQISTTYKSEPNATRDNALTQVRSNVRLVTADGVNFYYTSAGNAMNSIPGIVEGKKQKDGQGITISGGSKITTGNFYINNAIQDGSVNITDSTIETKKLIGVAGKDFKAEDSGTSGNIQIANVGKTTIQNSTLQTINDDYKDTKNIKLGNITITGNKGVDISNSKIKTADANNNTGDAGKIEILSSGGDINIKDGGENSIESAGNVRISADGSDVNIKNYTIKAYSDIGKADRDITISAGKNTAVNSSKLTAANITATASADNTIKASTLKASQNIDLAGKNTTVNASTLTAKNITANADAINIQGKSKLSATGNIKLYGKDTTIDNSSLKYNSLKFYDSEGKENQKVNNVTVQNNAKFNRTYKGNDYLGLVTNGDLTVDNTDLYSDDMTKAGKKGLLLEAKNITIKNTKNLTVNNGNITTRANGDVNIVSANISTTGNVKVEKANNVNVTDNSNVNAKNIKVTANKDVTVNTSKVWAKDGNVNITAKEGKISAKSDNKDNIAAIFAEGGTATLSQGADMNLNKDFGNSLVGGTTKLTLKSDGNVIANSLEAGKIDVNSYKNIPTLTDKPTNAIFTLGSTGGDIVAKENIKISNLKSAEKVKLEAKNIDVKGKDNTTLTDVTTKATGNTQIVSEKNLVINNLTIESGKKTTLEGSTIKTPSGKIIANNNKVALNSKGDIDVKVSGISEAENGLDVNADINTGNYNNNKYSQDDLIGRNVTIDAGNEALAISKIKADTLNLKAGKFVKGVTTLKNTDNTGIIDANGKDVTTIKAKNTDGGKRGYIEVRTAGGFNLDKSTTYDDSNKNMYTGANVGKTSQTSTEYGEKYTKVLSADESSETIENSELISSKTKTTVKKGEEVTAPVGEEKLIESKTVSIPVYDKDGNVIGHQTGEWNTYSQDYETRRVDHYTETKTNVYKDTETTVTTTTSTTQAYKDYNKTTNTSEKQHIVTLNDDEKDGFVLVYGKNKTDVKTGTVKVGKPQTKTETKEDTKVINENRVVKEVTESDKNVLIDKFTKTRTTEPPYVPCDPTEDIDLDI